MKYTIQQLEKFVSKVMEQAGLDLLDAQLFAKSLIYADACGVGSHGISRLATYAKRVANGVIATKAEPVVLRDAGALLSFDAKNGVGSVVAIRILNQLIEKAKQYGICFATVMNATHYGTGSFLTKYVADYGMVGFAAANSESAVVPTGGSVAMLGTNPISAAIPSKKYGAAVLDFATSSVARGKVVLAQKTGEAIPLGWAVDADGKDTSDPSEALKGAMLPFGGHKGYGISLLIELMCSGIGGSLNGRNTHHFWTDFENPQNIGFLLGVINTPAIAVDDSGARVDDILDEMKTCPTAPGVKEVLIPGEIEAKYYKAAQTEGLTLPEKIVDELKWVARKYHVEDIF